MAGNKFWKMIKNQARNTAEILIYEQIGKDYWTDEGIAAKDFAAELSDLGNITDIALRINSAGGSVFEGLTIHNLLKAHPATVTCYIDGLAASIASVIAMAANKICMPENALMMIHNPSGLVMGTAEEMRKMADTLDVIRGSIQAAYKRTNMSDEELSAMMTAETWLTAADCVEKGFADEMTTAVKAAANYDLKGFKNAPSALIVSLKNSGGQRPPGIEPHKEVRNMEKCTKCGAELVNGKCPVCAANEATATAQRKIEDNKKRVADIRALARNYELADLGMEFIESDKSVEEFQAAILEKKFNAKKAEHINIFLSQEEQSGYSINRAILCAADGRHDGIEAEVSNEIGKKLGRSTKGVFVPLNIRNAALTAGTPAAGGDLVQTSLMTLIEILRKKMMVRAMGAQVMSGLTGNVAFPRQTGATSLYWVGEAPVSDVTETEATFEQLILTPKTAQATTAFSRQLLQQSSVDVEAFVRNDLMLVNALGIDNACINGTGQSNQPTGILATSGIGAVVGDTNGALPTWAHMVALESKVSTANADIGALGYLTNPKVRGILKTTQKFSNYGSAVWEDEGPTDDMFGMGIDRCNGYKAGATTQVPSTLTKGSANGICSAIIFGNWSDLLIGEFGVMEIIADPYTLKKKGLIEVTTFLMVDLGVRHAESFAAMKDALTTGQ